MPHFLPLIESDQQPLANSGGGFSGIISRACTLKTILFRLVVILCGGFPANYRIVAGLIMSGKRSKESKAQSKYKARML